LSNNYYRKSKTKRRQSSAIRIAESMATQIRIALRGEKNGRSWEKLVGYTRDELVKHLESLFTDDMSWDNYGQWHIDHVLPQDSFKFSSAEDEQFKVCWSLSNLQPLWAIDNIRKGNRLPAGLAAR
jgi:hypothetical protein